MSGRMKDWGFKDPDDIGQSEYRLIYNFLDDSTDEEPSTELEALELCESMVSEIRGWADEIETKLGQLIQSLK